jgi:transketolase
MSVEDVGIVRSIPDILIYDAADTVQFGQALPQIIAYQGPVYIRIPRKYNVALFGSDYKFDLLKADLIHEGNDVTIFATGIMVKEALDAYQILKNQGVNAEIINVHTIKPLDEETILKSLKKTKKAVVCENHNIIGGLFSAISELAAQKYPVVMKPIGIKDRFGQVGKLSELMKAYEMTSGDIVNAVKSLI